MGANRNILALLVGIDQYPGSVPQLQGCVNDIEAFESYLQERINPHEYQLKLLKLQNQKATRQAVIDGFTQHLNQATENDIALFYYSGHGSQEQAPPEFWHLEPDHMNETLVCWDSRQPGGWDLADKELAYLIHQIDKKGPHIVLILDACHSGSGTRDVTQLTGVRHAPADRRTRTIQEFLFPVESLEGVFKPSTIENDLVTPSGWSIPQGKHVLLAGCQDREVASEYVQEGQPRGAFSYFLLNSLKKNNGSLSYRELFKRTCALVKSQIKGQTPQLEATNLDDLDLPFLGAEAIKKRDPYFTLSFNTQHGWVIDGGAVHGLPQRGETIQLALFPQGSTAEQMKHAAQAVGQAEVTAVLPHLSTVTITKGKENLTTDTVLNAVITFISVPTIGVCFEGDASAIALVQAEIKNSGLGEGSLYVRVVDHPHDAQLRVLAREDEYFITKPQDNKPLVATIKGHSQPHAKQVVGRLEHIARWMDIVELSSPANNRISANAVTMQVFNNGTESKDTQLRLEYQKNGDQWRQPHFQLKLTNHSPIRLYCALLDLTEQYSVSVPPLLPNGGIWLDPGKEVWAYTQKPIPTTVPEELWEQGITEYQDILKLIISTSEFDATLLKQDKLDSPVYREVKTYRNGTLNQRMHQIIQRDIGDEEVQEVDEWATSQIAITTVRPLNATQLRSDGITDLGTGVKVQPHSSLDAQARLTTVPLSTRDVGGHILPPLLLNDTVPFQFRNSRGVDPGLGVLELTQITNPDVVKPENPLTIRSEQVLGEDEYVLPIAYDGEFYLPLGRGQRVNNQTEIKIERLPEPLSEGKRSVGGSIRIFFQKIISKRLGKQLSKSLGIKFEYPILSIAEVKNGEVSYETNAELVAARVAAADKIVLFIHGIFGDSEKMLPCLETTMVSMNGQTQPMGEIYDLVLALDYESINTSNIINARKLKRKLREIGLGPNHGKTFHIVAHSMGGLVARWFVEQEDGSVVVQHLFLVGTPNTGSPWPEVQAGVTTVLAFALNSLGSAILPLKIFASLLKQIESIDVALDEMEPTSDFLTELNASNDPKIPYSIIAGNTSLITPDEDANRRERLLKKLAKTIEMPHLGEANDIAVSVESIASVSQERIYPPQVNEVACNHMVYFTDPSGLKVFGNAITLAFIPESISNKSQSTEWER